jgi:ABC-type sugar transport system ATPase subunit
MTTGEPMTAAPGAVAGVVCRGLTRTFGSTRALADVDLDIAPATIHALVGQNGAGKSTCLGLIAGRIAPTSGDVTVLGRSFHYGKPRSARDAGVAAVYQELAVIPHLSPQANVFLATPITRFGVLRKRSMRRRYLRMCEQLGIPAAPDVPAGELSVAQQQLIEIVRGVVSEAKVLLLDEPTAALAVAERRALFRVLDALRNGGTTIVFVSHNLDEVLANADTITVFRDGRLIETRPASAWNKGELIKRMLGEESSALVAAAAGESSRRAVRPVGPSAPGGVRLRATRIQLPGRNYELELEVREGEVLGLAGLMGSGRSSLLRALSGAEPGTRGVLEIDGVARPWPTSPRVARELGIGVVPEDRKSAGVCLEMSCADNVTLPRPGRPSRGGYLSPRSVVATALPHLRAAGVAEGKVRDLARSLSGGNQQKLLFARMSYLRPRILFADEPTRGVDVGAKADILDEVRRLAREDGVAVVLVSSELEEVIAYSDRILVMSEGRIVSELDNRDGQVSEEQVLNSAFATATNR